MSKNEIKAGKSGAAGKPRVLVVDDDSLFQMAMRESLRDTYETVSAYDTTEAMVIARKNHFAAILLDIDLKTMSEGLQALPEIKQITHPAPIIMISGRRDFASLQEAIRRGASDYVAKDSHPDELHHVLNRALDHTALRQQGEQSGFETAQLQKQMPLLGNSSATESLRKIIDRARNSPVNILITGETGTGKEIVARQLRGFRPDGSPKPFVAIDSSTIQSTMAESILFGHEKGAFTGADQMRRGIFEEANGGIVYFDEIANMPLEIQAKLLRVLQEKEVARLGTSKAIPLEFRVVAATNQNLDSLVAEGKFKADLIQRLNVIPVQILPLRDRSEDIRPLATYYIEKHGRQMGRSMRFSDDAFDVLETYAWPGNIRELVNVAAYLATMCESNEVDVADLPPKLRDAALEKVRSRNETSKGASSHESGNSDSANADKNFYDQVAQFEKLILQKNLDENPGNVSKLALKLGMDRSHLYKKLREHGLK